MKRKVASGDSTGQEFRMEKVRLGDGAKREARAKSAWKHGRLVG